MSAARRVLHAEALLSETGWIEPAFIELDADGCIASVGSTKPDGAVSVENLGGYVVPGFPNAHSHAFQYAMAGMAEHLPKGAGEDDFWSWRETMYALAERLRPEHVEAVAAMVYSEMLRFGITGVAEFHYVHHDAAGKSYAKIDELSARIIAGAETAGIALTLLPVAYQHGGFGKPAQPRQKRFLSASLDAYQRLVAAANATAKPHRDVVVGLAVHSLRAVAPDVVKAVMQDDLTNGPIHIHVAEQQREVDDCLQHLGERPVAWLLKEVGLSERHHLVHATHISDEEARGIAESKAGVVICPSTEGNLGDGFFPLRRFLELGGRYAIGTDSHIGLSPWEDLRWLDYGQRLRTERRNTICMQGGDDSAALLFAQSWRQGQRALGAPHDRYFSIGSPFDAVVLDPAHPILIGKPAERRLAALVFGGDVTALVGTLRRGRWLVQNGRHTRKAAIVASYAKAVKELMLGR